MCVCVCVFYVKKSCRKTLEGYHSFNPGSLWLNAFRTSYECRAPPVPSLLVEGLHRRVARSQD